ncbi:MAG TPA: hypothetical protein PLB14_03160 [Smithellaceae bacterium]|nr:hypothetical protein [Smithellaceae bacterium]
MNNTSSTHSGLDPESPKHLITLDTGFRLYDDIAGWQGLAKLSEADENGLSIIFCAT